MIPALVLAFAVVAAPTELSTAAPQPRPLTFRAYVSRCHDGDTCSVTVDLGLGLTVTDKIRLAGINAPEISGATRAAGILTRDKLCEKVCGHDVVIDLVPPDGREKYGRLLGTIWFHHENINRWLVDQKLAVEWNGEGARP